MFGKITRFTAARKGCKDGKRNQPISTASGINQISFFERDVIAAMRGQTDITIRKWENFKTVVVGELTDLIISYQQAHQNLLVEEKIYGKKIVPKKSWWVSISFFCFLIIEAPMNYFAFQFLRDPGVFTWILAIILTIIVPMAGHLAGKTFKNKQRKPVDIILAALLLIFSVSIITSVSMAREEHIRLSTSDATIAHMAFYIFLFGNAIIYLLAVVIGYSHGYDLPDYYAIIQRVQRKSRQYIDRQTDLKKKFTECLLKLRQIRNSGDWYADRYRDSNIKKRTTDAPPYFNDGTSIWPEMRDPYKTYLTLEYPEKEMWKEIETLIQKEYQARINLLNSMNAQSASNDSLNSADIQGILPSINREENSITPQK